MIKPMVMSILIASIFTSHSHASKPLSVAGKIAAGALQFIHRYPYRTAVIFYPYMFNKIVKNNNPTGNQIILTTLLWIGTGKVTKKVAEFIMNACDIEPLYY